MNKISSCLLYIVLWTSFSNSTITSENPENIQPISISVEEELENELSIGGLSVIEWSSELKLISEDDPFEPYPKYTFNNFYKVLWKLFKKLH